MSGLKNGVQVGQILGLMAAGIIAEKYGYKKTIVGALIMLTGFIFIFFFATHIAMLFAAGVLCGLPWVRWCNSPLWPKKQVTDFSSSQGAFQTLTTT
jgi:MFS family permease